MCSYTRRRVLSALTALAGLGAASGCLDGSSRAGGRGGPVARATFFVFADVAANVAGEHGSASALVPVGQHGHGWAPGPRIREEMYQSDLLLHGMDGFQPWVDDILGDVDEEGEDVVTVDVSADVDLLSAGAGGHDHDGDDQESDGHDSDGHDHGAVDPHFWLDPLRVADAASTVEAAFAEADSEHTDAYADSAAQYRSELESLHERLQSVRDAASNDVLLVAGHDAFQYLSARYDLQVESLTGVSPDDQPTTRAIETARDVVEEHDLQYVCADPLESQRAAEQLREETAVEEILPLTAMPGRSDAWAENDWGYVDVVENVNLPTLERALGAR